MDNKETEQLNGSAGGIDVKDGGSLFSNEVKRENRFVSAGDAIVEFLIRILIFLVGLIADVFKAIWKIIATIGKGIWHFLKGIPVFFSSVKRIWSEVDGSGKLSFFIQGAGNFKRHDFVNGFAFLTVEILWFLYMALMGGISVFNILTLNLGAYLSTIKGKDVFLSPTSDNDVRFVNGMLAIIVVIGGIIIYVKGIKSMKDNFIINNYSLYLKAHEDKLEAIEKHNILFKEDFSKLSKHKIRLLLLTKYGYGLHSAYEIASADWKHINDIKPEEKEPKGLKKSFLSIKTNVLSKLKSGRYGIVWSTFLPKPKEKEKILYGAEKLSFDAKKEIIAFRHTFAKYNDFHTYSRDTATISKAFAEPERLVSAIYARDQASISIGLSPVKYSEKIKTKSAMGRVVSAFGISLETAKEVTAFVLKLMKKNNDALKNGASEATVLNEVYIRLRSESSSLAAKREKFLDENTNGVYEAAKGIETCYSEYLALRKFYDQGKSAFIGVLVNSKHVTRHEAKLVYADYKRIIADNKDDESEIMIAMGEKTAQAREFSKLVRNTPYHGKCDTWKRTAKRYGDEKFATTVLTLPTIGVLLLTILPLICSIVVAFTNWDQYHTNKRFLWSLDAISSFFDMFTGSTKQASYGYTFFHLLGWTLVWAFFSTFTCYFFGILLALLINRKGIKCKGLFRTIFVVSIAVPQFITLLTMSILLKSADNGGPINQWLLSTNADGSYINTWYTNGIAPLFGFGDIDSSGVFVPVSFPFLGGQFATDHNTFWPKFTCIVVNMWIGIPFTMLSTSGILMNIPQDLYESSRIDGAGPTRQLFSITLPYVLFVTGPYLLTQFVGNINNFNVIYFLTGGDPTGGGRMVAPAGETDLLITWLYKLTVDKTDYSIASVIGILVFIVCAFFSLIVYSRLGSVKNEEDFQ